MEEDIKVVEHYMEYYSKDYVFRKAVENLIKRNKELEEKNIKLQKRNNRQFKLFGKRDKEIENLKNANKTLYELCQGKAMQEFINNECDYIPKSKVEEFLGKSKVVTNESGNKTYFLIDVTEIRQELLQEGDK